MKLYVMRHGETDWNNANLVQGHSDIPLNETGKNQALMQKDVFNQLDVDLIIASPLERTKVTAELVNSDKKVPIIFDAALKERCMGEFEGTVGSEIDFDKVNSIPYYRGVEPFSDLCDRVHAFLDKIKNDNKNILLVTHGGTARAIEAYFLNSKDYTLHLGRLKNCEIKEYTW